MEGKLKMIKEKQEIIKKTRKSLTDYIKASSIVFVLKIHLQRESLKKA